VTRAVALSVAGLLMAVSLVAAWLSRQIDAAVRWGR
jgi:hypothetical protein